MAYARSSHGNWVKDLGVSHPGGEAESAGSLQSYQIVLEKRINDSNAAIGLNFSIASSSS